ncbi:hypothetical protein IKG68_02985 [Candidatus Saccharibacteria bacterium]|nr:hypothetical protein [Candidatus Saccharibacteria bacterium]
MNSSFKDIPRDDTKGRRLRLFSELEMKLRENDWQIPSLSAIGADARMASPGTYRRYFGGVEKAVEMLARYKYGLTTEEELAEKPIELHVNTGPVCDGPPIYRPMGEVINTLTQALDALKSVYSNDVLESITFRLCDTKVIYIGREYYRSADNATILRRMTKVIKEAAEATGGRERNIFSRRIRDTGWQMQHPGPMYPCDP